MGIVYQAQNTITGKWYIGKTMQSLRDRKAAHLRDAKKGSALYFHRALMKYGFDVFEWTMLYESDDEKQLFQMATMLIQTLETKAPDGYNLTDGGEGASGRKHSEATKQKIRSSNQGKPVTQETRDKISKALTGKKQKSMPESAKEKLRQINLGKSPSKETREKIRQSLTGFKHSDATKEKLSRVRKGHLTSTETRKKISEAQKGRKLTDEHRAKLSEAKKGGSWSCRRRLAYHIKTMGKLNLTPILMGE